MLDATRYQFFLRDGTAIASVVQGRGGLLQGIPGLLRLRGCLALAKIGRKLPIFEPRPGCIRHYPNYSAAGDGPNHNLDLRGVLRIEKQKEVTSEAGKKPDSARVLQHG